MLRGNSQRPVGSLGLPVTYPLRLRMSKTRDCTFDPASVVLPCIVCPVKVQRRNTCQWVHKSRESSQVLTVIEDHLCEAMEKVSIGAL